MLSKSWWTLGHIWTWHLLPAKQVNSVEGDAFQMKEELRNAEEVTIKVRRQEVYALERARVMKQAQILASLLNLSGGAPGRLSNGNSVG